MTSETITNDTASVQEVNETDNSNVVNQEPSNDDNSSNFTQTEPVDKTEEQVEGKFKSLEEATKSYSELEKKLGENSTELGQLRKQAQELQQLKEKQSEFLKSYGFDSVEQFEQFQMQEKHTKELAAFEADEYSKHLENCQFPDEMKNLLLRYRQNPSTELLNMIEAEFPVDVIKSVAGKVELAKGQLQSQIFEAQKAEVIKSAQEYLDINVNKYSEEFKNPAFTELYSEAFKAFGTALDSDKFVSLMKSYAESVLKNANLQNAIKDENNSATNEIAGLTAGTSTLVPEKPLNAMSDKELQSYIKKYV